MRERNRTPSGDTTTDLDALPPPKRSPRRDTRAMETVLLASTACLLAAVAWPIATGSLPRPAHEVAVVAPGPVVAAVQDRSPSIQIALLLDTSGSMDGLIDQARARLWSVVNSLDSATYHGDKPRLEVALYEYGNDGISFEQGHIRQIVGFTSELDVVSQALFALRTNGGAEHAPQAIARSLDELAWQRGDGALRVLYIAGNEEFQQGPVSADMALARARARGVVPNMVFCGAEQNVDATAWRVAAARAGGRFFSIDHNAVRADPPTPFDDEIAQLGVSINSTYVAYGSRGRAGLENQAAQDDNSATVGSGVDRGLSKANDYYRNPSWDLVDGLDEGVVDLASVERGLLPDALAGLDAVQLGAFVAARKAEREAISARISELRRERDAFLAAHRVEDGAGGETLDSAMVRAAAEQAERAGFTLGRS